MSNKKFLIGVSVFLLALLVGAVFLVVHVGNNAQNSSGSKSVASTVDSGVAVCKEMAAPAPHPTLDETWRSMRVSAFENSRYQDLRIAGVNLTNAAYTMEKELKDSDITELNELNSKLETTHAELRTACKNHGIELPALGS